MRFAAVTSTNSRMQSYPDAVRASFAHTETDELLDDVTRGLLTEEAHAVAIAELAGRGLDVRKLPRTPPSDQPGVRKSTVASTGDWVGLRVFVVAGLSMIGLPIFTFFLAMIAGSLASDFRGSFKALGGLPVSFIGLLPIYLSWRQYVRAHGESAFTQRRIRGIYGFWLVALLTSGLFTGIGIFWVVSEAFK